MILIFITFSVLVGLTALIPQGNLRPEGDRPYFAKPLHDWVLDGAGLAVQGLGIPLVQILLVYHLWATLLPHWQGTVAIGSVPAFLLSFVVVDYLYYWNHRLLHHRHLWAVHAVHHTVTHMDVLGTSRNTLWSSLLILYVWVHSLFIYCLTDPTAYLLGVSLTAALDLWRHSGFSPRPQNGLGRALSAWLILPSDHAQHHSSHPKACNFGANFNLWDKWHGTYQPPTDFSPKLGIPLELTLTQKLVFPYKLSRRK